MPATFERIVDLLEREGVRYVVVGGLAAVTHGSPYLTDDLDLVYERSQGNIEALVRALAPIHPRLRTRAGDVPMLWDARTITNGLQFTLRTDEGDLDLLGEIAGVGGYEAAAADADSIELYGHSLRILNLPKLIASKKAAGRPKDLLHVDALEEILRQRS